MLPHRHYTRDRLRRTEERLAALVRPERAAVDTLEIAGPVDRVTAAEADALDYAPVALGAELGPLFATYWLARHGHRAARSGPAPASTCCRHPQRGDAVGRRASRSRA